MPDKEKPILRRSCQMCGAVIHPGPDVSLAGWERLEIVVGSLQSPVWNFTFCGQCAPTVKVLRTQLAGDSKSKGAADGQP